MTAFDAFLDEIVLANLPTLDLANRLHTRASTTIGKKEKHA
jgi:hypothetical protein